jgi:hypothetical protein
MPRYFFNVFHQQAEQDSSGEELAGRHAAWKEETVTAGQLLQKAAAGPRLADGSDRRIC